MREFPPQKEVDGSPELLNGDTRGTHRRKQVALNLKFLRVQSGMTLEQLAADSGLTRSYLSKIERGLSNPSIESALKLASALGVSVEKLFGQQTEEESIRITRAKRGQAGDVDTHLSLIAGVQGSGAMRAFIVRPGKSAPRGRIMSHHEGEEILFVLSGRIEMQIGKRREALSKGDCVHFDSTLPHRLVTVGEEPAAALVVVAATGN